LANLVAIIGGIVIFSCFWLCVCYLCIKGREAQPVENLDEEKMTDAARAEFNTANNVFTERALVTE
jgi:hypothetical protein